jgi:hypothetical protein
VAEISGALKAVVEPLTPDYNKSPEISTSISPPYLTETVFRPPQTPTTEGELIAKSLRSDSKGI